MAARAAADQHPPTLDQAVLADFIVEGHFARHLRRMRVAYRERLEALTAAAERYCGGALRLRPVQTGLHALADLDGRRRGARLAGGGRARASRRRRCRPTSRGRGAAPTASSSASASVRPDASRRGMERLAAAIEAARRR